MALQTQDNDAAVEFTAQWGTAPTHVHLLGHATNNTPWYGAMAISPAITPSAGATVRIPAGDLNFTADPGTNVADAYATALLNELGTTSFPIHVALSTNANSNMSGEITATGYSRQQVTAIS